MTYKLVYIACRLILFLMFRLKITGRENIPSGAALVAANHTSYLDPVLVAITLGLNAKLAIMAKAELLEIPVFGAILRGCGAFAVRRGKADILAVKKSLGALKDGKKLLIFPEGTRVRGGEDAEAKSGCGMLAVRTGEQILPVYVSPQKRLFSTIFVIVGAPFDVKRESPADSALYRTVATDILNRVKSLADDGASADAGKS